MEPHKSMDLIETPLNMNLAVDALPAPAGGLPNPSAAPRFAPTQYTVMRIV